MSFFDAHVKVLENSHTLYTQINTQIAFFLPFSITHTHTHIARTCNVNTDTTHNEHRGKLHTEIHHPPQALP